MAKETEEEIKNREMIEEIATNIAQLNRSVSALLTGRLKKKSLVILLAHSAQLPHRTVEAVLNSIASLERDHLNK